MFYGDKLLTAANPAARADLALLRALDLRPHTLPVRAAVRPKIFRRCWQKFVDVLPAKSGTLPTHEKVPPPPDLLRADATQCLAISGGPVYGGSGNVSTIGSYSGILQGVTEIDASSSSAPRSPATRFPGGTQPRRLSNALGLFDLVVPGTTTATGAFLLFADGVVFGGTISASVDPDTAKLAGILNGQYNFNVSDVVGTAVTTMPVTATAVGMINAKVSAGGQQRGFGGAPQRHRQPGHQLRRVINTTSRRSIARVITFTVTGFQTTTATNTSSTIGTATGSDRHRRAVSQFGLLCRVATVPHRTRARRRLRPCLLFGAPGTR